VTVLWQYYWPIVAIGIVIGAVTGTLLYNRLVISARDRLAGLETAVDDRKRKRRTTFMAGVATTVGLAIVWHWPLGAADRLTGHVEAAALAELKHQEMFGVTARLERSPLRRRVVLSGPADDFQQAELIRILDELPGVSGVRWATPPAASTESVQ
jgi:hypothetical protein